VVRVLAAVFRNLLLQPNRTVLASVKGEDGLCRVSPLVLQSFSLLTRNCMRSACPWSRATPFKRFLNNAPCCVPDREEPENGPPPNLLAPPKPGNAELFHAETEYDWNGDGVPDHFRLRAQREVAPPLEGLEDSPSRKQHWAYHCWLLVESGYDNSILWEDQWSVKESEITSFREILDFKSADEFFLKWFTWKFTGENSRELNLNYFEVRPLEDREISEDVLANEMKRLKINGVSATELKREILGNKSSRIFVYRSSLREDIRWAVYVPSLRQIMMFQHGFAD
jgi:hypothetical protein